MSRCGSWRLTVPVPPAGDGAGTDSGRLERRRDADVRVSLTENTRKSAKRKRKAPVALFMITPEARGELLTPQVVRPASAQFRRSQNGKEEHRSQSDHFRLLTGGAQDRE